MDVGTMWQAGIEAGDGPPVADLVARWPLPEGVADALVNKAQLGVALGVSETTLSAWLRQGLPAEEDGTNGRPYRFRLSDAYAWMMHRRSTDAEEQRASDEAARQLQMALLGGETAAAGTATGATPLSPGEQRKVLELELLHAQAARQRGELVRRDDVVAAFEDVFATLRTGLDAAPDMLARALNLSPIQVQEAERVLDDVIVELERRVREHVGRADTAEALDIDGQAPGRAA